MPARIVDKHVGGNTTYARSLEAGLTARGHEVLRIPSAGHPVGTLALETLAGMKKGGPSDLLHYVADTGPLVRTRGPSVVTVHGVASRWISTARSPRQEKIWRTRVSRAIASTRHVITVSQSSKNDIVEVFGVHPEGITVIPHGIEQGTFSTPRTLSPETAARVPTEFILYLGNVEPRKNLMALVEAFQLPEVRDLGLPLVIAGKPAWNFQESMDAIVRAGNVIHLGFVSEEDKVALMQRCTIFAFPSLYEGFGFPVLEAMAAGAAVVTTDRGSLAEIAGPALVFDDTTPPALASGLVRAMTDDTVRDASRTAGLEWVDRFSWDASVDAHLEVYRRVLTS